MRPIKIITIFFLLCGSASAAAVDLPRDGNGWTVFSPSDDSRICYIDPSGGNDSTAEYYDDDDAAVGSDPFNPDGPINAYATYAAAFADTRAGYPDWILLQRGDTLTESNLNIRNGRDSDEPFLVGAYGSSGASPIVQTGQASGIYRNNDGVQYVAVSGIDFYSHQRDPGNGGYVGTDGEYSIRFWLESGQTTKNVLFEGCKFRFFVNSFFGNGNLSPGYFYDVEFYRCVITDNYNASGHSQGLYIPWGETLISECIFDHNGWYADYGDTPGPPTIYNHNTYFPESRNTVFEKNISMRSSNTGFKFTCSGVGRCTGIEIKNNLLIDNEYGMSVGTNYGHVDLRYVSPLVVNNIITKGAVTRTSQNKFFGVDIAGWNGGRFSNNLIMNSNESVTNTYGIQVIDQTENVTIADNIVYNLNSADAFICGDEVTNSNETDSYYVKSGISVSNNIFQLPSNSEYLVHALTTLTGFAFSGNTYYSDDDTDLARVNTTDYNLSGWQALEEANATWEQTAFTDNSRDVDTWNSTVNGGTGTVDAFIAACRAQDRYSWDYDIDAAAINDSIEQDLIWKNTECQNPTPQPPERQARHNSAHLGTGPNQITVGAP